eukprot:TRINITY_DN861_c0_g1_i2.p3 TRINITY_DN861_c0_g1~~TRINITY_DN861_c0_g1_i2.p3  ORF type:complete len:104 (+),score=10.79 TRINITY_DN861_c0_g1_i2:461-772(+)
MLETLEHSQDSFLLTRFAIRNPKIQKESLETMEWSSNESSEQKHEKAKSEQGLDPERCLEMIDNLLYELKEKRLKYQKMEAEEDEQGKSSDQDLLQSRECQDK